MSRKSFNVMKYGYINLFLYHIYGLSYVVQKIQKKTVILQMMKIICSIFYDYKKWHHQMNTKYFSVDIERPLSILREIKGIFVLLNYSTFSCSISELFASRCRFWVWFFSAFNFEWMTKFDCKNIFKFFMQYYYDENDDVMYDFKLCYFLCGVSNVFICCWYISMSDKIVAYT